MPAYLTTDARDLIRKLLKRQVSARLGSGPTDALLIKQHRFFEAVPWNAVLHRNMEPPFKPSLVCYFTFSTISLCLTWLFKNSSFINDNFLHQLTLKCLQRSNAIKDIFDNWFFEFKCAWVIRKSTFYILHGLKCVIF